jgi:aminoglycoside/choline kinase family phosphotransferase
MTDKREHEIRAFLKDSGWDKAKRNPLQGDASTRRYERLSLNGRSAMLMDQPQAAEAPTAPAGASPEERRALGYNAVARLAGADCARFVAASNFLRGLGLSAPEIFASEPKKGLAVIEDLGDDLYSDILAKGTGELALYTAAADVLAKLQARGAPQHLAADKPLHAYDETALLAEAALLPEWYVPMALGRDATAAEIDEYQGLWREVLTPLLSSRSVFVHRDFHAQNLLWLPKREGAKRVGLIDFQDAVAGLRAYDLISLIEDARRDVSPDLAERTTRHYLEALRKQGETLDEESFRAQMAVVAAQRNAKIAGIFARLFVRDAKPRYLDYLPRVWANLNSDLEHPALARLKAWFDRTIPLDARGAPSLANRGVQ